MARLHHYECIGRRRARPAVDRRTPVQVLPVTARAPTGHSKGGEVVGNFTRRPVGPRCCTPPRHVHGRGGRPIRARASHLTCRLFGAISLTFDVLGRALEMTHISSSASLTYLELRIAHLQWTPVQYIRAVRGSHSTTPRRLRHRFFLGGGGVVC